MAPSGKIVVLRGNQYTNFFFLKRIDVDSPFSFVFKKLVFHVVDTSIFLKGTLIKLEI